MLIAHFDESYGEGIYAVAGYVAPVKIWNEFTREWQDTLTSHPKIAYFHMADAAGRHNPLQGLSRGQIDSKIEAFVQIVERYASGMFGILCVVEEAPLRAVLPPRLLGPLYSDPYDFCLKRCIQSTRQSRNERRLNDKVRFIFDKGPLSEAERADVHRYVKEIEADNPAFFAGEILFENDTDVIPLQASDMVTWHLRFHAARRIEPQPGSILARLMKPGFNHGWWSEKAIREYFVPLLQFIVKSGKPKTLEDLRRIRAEFDRLQHQIIDRHDH